MNSKELFSSFFMGGYECAYHKTKFKRHDILADTKHEEYCKKDYDLLRKIGIATVREGLSWNYIDKGFKNYNFGRFEELMKIGSITNTQQIWDLNHFDYPDDIDPFTDEFIYRFAAYAKEAVKVIRKYHRDTIFIVPFNEISFFSWIAGEVGVWAPFTLEAGFKLKVQCVKAVLAAIDEIKVIDKNVKFIHTDPIMHRIAKKNSSEDIKLYVKFFKEYRFQSWDMIAGKLMPGLGGNLSYLDIIGINYYLHNQEYIYSVEKNATNEFHRPECKPIPWQSKNRISLQTLCNQIYRRYKRPMIIAETGCYGDLRSKWWSSILYDLQKMIDNELPILGVCAYPIIDRPDWDHGHLTNSGMWDFHQEDPMLNRVPHHESIELVKAFIDHYNVTSEEII